MFPSWKTEFSDEIADVIGILAVMLGFLFRIAARGTKKEHSNSGNTLVKVGPYEMIRHPMYVGTFLIGLGIVCLLFHGWIAVLLLIVFLAIYTPQLSKEEMNLKKRFKEEYETYARRTPRLIPSLYAVFHLQEYVSIRWAWLKDEWKSIIFVIPFIFVIEALRDAVLFGTEELMAEPVELLTVIVIFLLLVLNFKPRNKPIM